MYHGYGVMRFENGYVYEGNWKEGKRNGIGKATFTDGMIYEGDYLDGQRHGIGTCLLYTSPSPRDATLSRMPSSA